MTSLKRARASRESLSTQGKLPQTADITVHTFVNISKMASNSPPPPIPKSFSVYRRWSGESVLADYREIQATAMGVSKHDNGQFALLGGRKYLGLVKLSEPKNVALKVPRSVGKWEVTSVQWAPVLPDRIAIAANDRIEVLLN